MTENRSGPLTEEQVASMMDLVLSKPVWHVFQECARLGQQIERERCAKALEFAEYLAQSAQSYQKAADSIHEHYIEGEEPPDYKRESYSDHYRDVSNSIYEFRKRAAAIQSEP